MIMHIDLETARLHQRELMREAHRAQLTESSPACGCSLTTRVVRALTRWLSRPVQVAEADQLCPRLEQYPYGRRP
jgi:hypothetical protein